MTPALNHASLYFIVGNLSCLVDVDNMLMHHNPSLELLALRTSSLVIILQDWFLVTMFHCCHESLTLTCCLNELTLVLAALELEC